MKFSIALVLILASVLFESSRVHSQENMVVYPEASTKTSYRREGKKRVHGEVYVVESNWPGGHVAAMKCQNS